LERIGPNRIFVHNNPEHSDQFSVDLSHLHKTSTAFSYRVFSEDSNNLSLAKYAPLLVKPAWKVQGDKLGLLLQYQLNPQSNFTSPVTLHNVAFVVSYNGKATGAQTKPSGTHIKDRHLVYWRLGDVTLTHETQKIVCRIIGAEGVEPTPGLVQAKWEYISSAEESMGSGISVAVLEEPSKDKGKGKEIAEDDPFADTTVPASQADEQRWTDIPLWRKLVSGDYEARASAVSP
jgi:F-BAR domain only protein